MIVPAVRFHRRIKMLKRQCTDVLDSTCSANEYSSVTDTFKIDHGKWARTSFRPWSTASSVCDGEPTGCKKRTVTAHCISRKARCSREQDQMPDTPLPR